MRWLLGVEVEKMGRNGETVDVVEEGALLWLPPEGFVRDARITDFSHWLRDARGLDFAGYDELWRWSVEHQSDFWRAIWDYFDVQADGVPEPILSGKSMFEAGWLEANRSS